MENSQNVVPEDWVFHSSRSLNTNKCTPDVISFIGSDGETIGVGEGDDKLIRVIVKNNQIVFKEVI